MSKITILLTTAILILGFSVVPSIRCSEKICNNLDSDSFAYDWPMFHHDLRHSGYTASTAPDTNDVLWSYTTGGSIYSNPSVVNGKIYFGSNDNNMYCLDAGTGNLIWNYTASGPINFPSPAFYNGKIYFGSFDHNVYCLNADTGAWIWDYTTGNSIGSSPAIYNGRVYIGGGDAKVYCLDADTGGWLWDYTRGGGSASSPAIYNGRVYIGGGDAKVYCLDADTGGWIWDYTTGYYVFSSPAIANGKVYFESDKVYCLNADNGAFVWDYPLGLPMGQSSPAVANGKIYIGSAENILYCLNADTGAWLWDYTTGGGIRSSPAVADGKVYVGSWDHKVYCLDANTGAWIWDYTTGFNIDSSPAIYNGNVYIGSSDDELYCFGSNSNSPPSVDITSPNNDQTISGLVTITGTASDPDGDNDIKVVKVRIDSNRWQETTGKTSWSFVWNTSEAENGQHMISAYAYDKQFALSEVVSVNVNVNNIPNQPPTLSINYPIENDVVSDLVNISGIASDINGNESLTQVDIKIDDGVWNLATGTTDWFYNWDTTQETDGAHSIYARSYDGTFYSNISMVNVSVSNAIPEMIITLSGGFRINAEIKNDGSTTAYNIDWTIDLTGGLILRGGYSEGVIDELAVGESEIIRLSSLFGIGPTTITVTSGVVTKQASGFILGPLVLNVREI